MKRRAMQLMKQRKMYDQQLGQLMDMEFNMSSMMMAQETMESTVATVAAMKETAKTMKKAQKAGKLDIGAIESLQDELADMMEDANEIQEVLGQSFALPDDCDEDSLMAELDMLEEDMVADELLGDGMPEVPDYVRRPPRRQEPTSRRTWQPSKRRWQCRPRSATPEPEAGAEQRTRAPTPCPAPLANSDM